MKHVLTAELYWMTLTLVMTATMWVPTIVNRITELGVWATLKVPKLHAEAPWADRLMRAHANAIENLAIFAPLVLAVQVTGMNTASTTLVCSVYFLARLVHALAYIAAVPIVRTLAFVAGFGCQMALAITLLGNF